MLRKRDLQRASSSQPVSLDGTRHAPKPAAIDQKAAVPPPSPKTAEPQLQTRRRHYQGPFATVRDEPGWPNQQAYCGPGGPLECATAVLGSRGLVEDEEYCRGPGMNGEWKGIYWIGVGGVYLVQEG